MIYARRFKEGFLRSDIEKAINIACRLIGKKIGKKVYLCQIPEDVEKIGTGKISGISAMIDGGWMLRFNTKFNSASSDIVSVDIWLKIRNKPDFTIETNGISIIKIIDVIVNTFLNKETNIYKFDENVTAMGVGEKSVAISKSINAWFREMGIDEDKLANTRLKHLYNQSYLYWYKSVNATEDYVLVNESSFRNYLIQAFEKNGITNIFMRDVSVSKAGKEKKIVSQKGIDEFDKLTYAMTLSDTIEFLKSNVRLITRGFSTAKVICGCLGRNTLIDIKVPDKIYERLMVLENEGN